MLFRSVAAAAGDRLPGHAALAETMRRRRASGGPAEQTFATLVGLQLRPRRLRDAATVWAALGQQRGSAERDRLWSHPDLLPTSEDLDEPLDFVARQSVDDELAALTADDAERAPDRASDDGGASEAEGGTDAAEDEDRREPGGQG